MKISARVKGFELDEEFYECEWIRVPWTIQYTPVVPSN